MPVSLHSISIQNFRLLHDVTFSTHELATVIVGRNNSGKSSVRELLKRFFSVDRNSTFPVEDFSFLSHEKFLKAFNAYRNSDTSENILDLLPGIELRLTFSYDADDMSFGALSGLVVDLDENCSTAIAVIRFSLLEDKLADFFASIDHSTKSGITLSTVMQGVREALSRCYATKIYAEDPTNADNTREIDRNTLGKIIDIRFIDANRALNEETTKDKGDLAKVLMALFDTGQSDLGDPTDKELVSKINSAMENIQQQIHDEVAQHLEGLLPSLEIFGYPNLPKETRIRTETRLDAKVLLEKDHTKVRYEGVNGIQLPEAYNGLGTRNLILILFRLHEYFRSYQSSQFPPCVQLVSIEEPEAHLHSQMQAVFIKQLTKLKEHFSTILSPTDDQKWPVQFIISTHSPHIANAASFSQVRYFLAKSTGNRSTITKDLSELGGPSGERESFLHNYLTLTRCDLFFADKIILIEGTAERFLVPEMMKRIDISDDGMSLPLSSQYISMIEVGGAHAKRFFNLVRFLDLPTLIITDIDTVKSKKIEKGKTVYVKSLVLEGERTANSTLKEWYKNDKITPKELLEKSESDKIEGLIRISYQVPEDKTSPCGRSLEEAFILANLPVFQNELATTTPTEKDVSELAQQQKKSEFALSFSIGVERPSCWTTPRYIAEGLCWLKNVGEDQNVLRS